MVLFLCSLGTLTSSIKLPICRNVHNKLECFSLSSLFGFERKSLPVEGICVGWQDLHEGEDGDVIDLLVEVTNELQLWKNKLDRFLLSKTFLFFDDCF